MLHYKDYVAGWFDSSVHEFFERFPAGSAKMDFALITCLDSNLAPASLLKKSPQLEPVTQDAKRKDSAIMLPTPALLEAIDDNQIFFGFDEVWFFPSDHVSPKPKTAWLVGPKRIDQRKLDILGPWMAENDCSLALGDGDGLNFVVKARGLAKYLLAYSTYQMLPETGGEAVQK